MSTASGPMADGGNGRDSSGRFSPGNRAAAGRPNPYAERVGAWRRALAKSVSAADIRVVVQLLIARAKGGEAWAIRELLDRCLGKPLGFADLQAEIDTGATGGITVVFECVEGSYDEHTTPPGVPPQAE